MKIKTFFISLLIFLSFSINAKAEFFSDIIITSPNGIWTDSRAYTNLNDAITAVGANQRTVKIVSPQVVTNLTVPANVTLEFGRDGSITNSGQLTINTLNIISDNHQIFTGAGDIDFAQGSIIKSSWFANIDTAIALTSDDSITLKITKQETLHTTVALGNNVKLSWEANQLLGVASGITLSNIGQISAGKHQIFSGPGSFRFKTGTVLDLVWFANLRAALSHIDTTVVSLTVSGVNVVDFDTAILPNITLDMDSQHGQFSITPGIAFSFGYNVSKAKPEWFMGKADGITDNRLPIQNAIDSLVGGEVVLGSGTYLISSFSSGYYTVKPKSNVSIIGNGLSSIVKIDDGMRLISRGVTVFYDHSAYFENVRLANFTIDFNGANNLDSWHNVNSSINRVGGASGVKNIHIEGMTFKNASGAHFIYLSNEATPANESSLVVITNNIFENCGGSIAGNLTTDHSSIYVNAENATITNNILRQPNLNDTVATAIEVHNSGNIISGNSIYRYRKGMNLGSELRSSEDIIVSNNIFREVATGISLWSAGAYVYKRVTIANNSIKLREVVGINAIGIESLATQMASSANGAYLKILGNTIVGPDTQTMTGYANMGIALLRWDDVSIDSNTIVHFAREGIYIEAEAAARKLRRYKISGNQIRSCGIGNDAVNKSAIILISGTTVNTDDIDKVMINHNQIDCDALTGTDASYGINLAAGRIPYAQLEWNHIVNYAIAPIYKTVNIAAGDILLIRGAGPVEPWDLLKATYGSTWADTTQAKFYNAIVPGQDGTDEIWQATSYVTAIPTAGTHRVGDRAIMYPITPGTPTAWVCTVGGTPGTWIPEAYPPSGGSINAAGTIYAPAGASMYVNATREVVSSTAIPGAGTTAAGTVPMTVGGATYNVLWSVNP